MFIITNNCFVLPRGMILSILECVFVCLFAEVVHINGVESVAETAIRALSERSKSGKKTPLKTSTLIITGVKRVSIVYLDESLLIHYITTGQFVTVPIKGQDVEKHKILLECSSFIVFITYSGFWSC